MLDGTHVIQGLYRFKNISSLPCFWVSRNLLWKFLENKKASSELISTHCEKVQLPNDLKNQVNSLDLVPKNSPLSQNFFIYISRSQYHFRLNKWCYVIGHLLCQLELIQITIYNVPHFLTLTLFLAWQFWKLEKLTKIQYIFTKFAVHTKGNMCYGNFDVTTNGSLLYVNCYSSVKVQY